MNVLAHPHGMFEFGVEAWNITLALQYPGLLNATQELTSVPIALEWWEGLSRKEEAREGIMGMVQGPSFGGLVV